MTANHSSAAAAPAQRHAPEPTSTFTDDVPAVVSDLLLRAARLHPGHGVGVIDGADSVRWITYPELLEEARRLLGGLRGQGLAQGDPVLFQLPEIGDFVVAFWACMLGGLVPVPVSIAATYDVPHASAAKLVNAWTLLDQPLVLAGSALVPQLGRLAAREAPGMRVADIAMLRMAAPAAPQPPAPDDLALLLLTSGSTGMPKLVQQPHRNLVAWARSVAPACGFSAADVSINWMPLDHVGGIVMSHLRDTGTACRQLHAPTELVLRDPLLWLDWIDRHRATATWAPNFAYALVNDHAEEIGRRRWDLSSMRFILNGGEAIASRTARRFLRLLAPHGLPADAMHPAWGMSETCSGVTYSGAFALASTTDTDAFVSVGAPIPGVELRIVDADDRAVPDGRPGRLQVRGISATPGYLRNPAATREAFTADGWFITGDLGVLRDGTLTIVGREKDVIIINGVNFYSHEIEAVAEEVAGVAVSFAAACAVRLPDEEGERLAVFFSPTAAADAEQVARALRATIAQRCGITPDVVVPLAAADMPKTAIGKIQRALLRERFEAGDLRALPPGDAAPAAPLLHWTWRPEALGDGPGLPDGSVVAVLLDRRGLGQACVDRLRAAGTPCIAVAEGQPFRRDGNDATVDPSSAAELRALFAGLAVSHVIDCRPYDPPPAVDSVAALLAAQARGSLGLLRLLRAWSPPDADAPRLLVACAGLDDGTAFVHGPIQGLVATLAHEHASLSAALVDFAQRDPAGDAALLVRELMQAGGPAAVLVRSGQRMVPMLARLSPADAPDAPVFAAGGIWLIAGGGGGIAGSLTAHLHRHGARVVLLGRTLADGTGDTDALIHVAGDASDLEDVHRAVVRAAARWGPGLDGVIHLAAAYHEVPLTGETDEAFLGALRSKLGAAWTLHQVARAHPGCRFVSFSSALARFGALGTGAYAAANAGLDAFARAQRHDGVRAVAIQWSLWRDTGIGRGVSRATLHQHGYLALPPEENLALLDAILRSGAAAAVAGLDEGHAAIRRLLDPAAVRAIPAAREPIAPRTPTERALAEQWRRLLKRDDIGVDDNFFDIGGRSLLAARLFAWIERTHHRSLPLATLYATPTIAGLAALLDTRSAPASTSATPAYAIQPLGGLPPLFCIPGVGSDVIVFDALSRALGPTQPLYALQLRTLDGTQVPARTNAQGSGPSETIEAAAADILREIRVVQPAGPYRLVGHCFGGLLAWEVARQMRAAGQEVALLALLDPVATNQFPDAALARERVAFAWRKLLTMGPIERIRWILAKLRTTGQLIIVRRRLGRAIGQARAMHAAYRLAAYDGPIDVFLAEDSHFTVTGTDPRRHLEQFAGGGARYATVPGNHDTMLHAPWIEALARRLRDRL